MIDTKGNWAITPRFDQLLPMSHGLAQATIGEMVGYVNAKGERRLWFGAGS